MDTAFNKEEIEKRFIHQVYTLHVKIISISMKTACMKGKKCLKHKLHSKYTRSSAGVSGIYIFFWCNTKNDWSATERRNTYWTSHYRSLSVKIKMFMSQSQSISPARLTSQTPYTQRWEACRGRDGSIVGTESMSSVMNDECQVMWSIYVCLIPLCL